MDTPITRKRLLIELGIKNTLVFVLFWGVYSPMSISPMLKMSPELLESVISLMGFLMAAAIIGAFELSYTRTNLNDPVQRYLAHVTKFTLYSSIMLLMEIALIPMSVAGGEIIGVLVMASMPVGIALFLYDFWDALRALDEAH